eukprot:3689575-Pyramimonas_sp.AAC.1
MQGNSSAAASVDYTCTGGQGTLIDYVVASASALEYLERAHADADMVGEGGQAHYGIVLDLLLEAK